MELRKQPETRAPIGLSSGFSLVELSIAMSLSILVLGAIFAVQRTAVDSFDGSMSEQKLSQTMRVGMGRIKSELRSALAESVVVTQWSGVNGDPVLSFQQAVDFNAATGTTTWGGGTVGGGRVEYVVQGSSLVRRVLDGGGYVVAGQDEVLVRNLDLSTAFASPIRFIHDTAAGVLGVEIRTEMQIRGESVKRTIDTMVHLESVFNF